MIPYYYKCAGAKRKKDCKKKPAKKDFIERAAVVLTVNRVLKDEEIDRIADGILTLQASEDTTIPALKKQLADTERGIENMLNAIQQGVLTSSTKERLEALEKQRDNLKIAVLQAELQKPKYTKEQIVSWIGQFKYGDVNSREYQKRIIDTFVNSLYVFDDRLVITYNFKGGTETITLKDVEATYGSDLKAMSPPQRPPRNRFGFPGACFSAPLRGLCGGGDHALRLAVHGVEGGIAHRAAHAPALSARIRRKRPGGSCNRGRSVL